MYCHLWLLHVWGFSGTIAAMSKNYPKHLPLTAKKQNQTFVATSHREKNDILNVIQICKAFLEQRYNNTEIKFISTVQ